MFRVTENSDITVHIINLSNFTHPYVQPLNYVAYTWDPVKLGTYSYDGKNESLGPSTGTLP
ncbi:hypothetical protein ACFL0D_01820 [Thermoproteota archaeon]